LLAIREVRTVHHGRDARRTQLQQDILKTLFIDTSNWDRASLS
jgi:hypothetical protein